MQPWMIIAALMGAGVLTLLVAPRIHRRSTERARAAATAHRNARAEELRHSGTSVEYRLGSYDRASTARDALVLHGVRAAIVRDAVAGPQNGVFVLVAHADDAAVVESVLNQLELR